MDSQLSFDEVPEDLIRFSETHNEDLEEPPSQQRLYRQEDDSVIDTVRIGRKVINEPMNASTHINLRAILDEVEEVDS